MFNFQNLNDYEFEIVSKDILEKDTGLNSELLLKGEMVELTLKHMSMTGLLLKRNTISEVHRQN